MKPSKTFFISAGSNVEPQKNVPACLEILKKKFRVKAVSSIYETEPVSMTSDSKFWNLALAIESDLNPAELKKELRAIETSLGRVRDPKNKFAPRTIDLDLLPQPDYQKLSFVIVPLAEIAPREVDLESGKTFAELAQEPPLNKK